MNRWTDFHAHILPQADHGCDSLDTALRQLKLAQNAGIGCIVATPHFYPDRRGTEEFPAMRDKAIDELREGYTGPVEILAGAEVFLCEGLQNYPQLSKLRIENTNILLVEMPTAPWPTRLLDTLCALRDAGYEPLLAHIDRYPRRDMNGLLASGFRGQLNPEGILPLHRRARAFHLVGEGTVCALGSDIHGASPEAYRDYIRAMRVLADRGILLQKNMKSLLGRYRQE
jgi:Capsular polysaccharide biosynthesis protein